MSNAHTALAYMLMVEERILKVIVKTSNIKKEVNLTMKYSGAKRVDVEFCFSFI